VTRPLALLALVLLGACASTPEAEAPPHVRLETTEGDILLRLDPDAAPISTANFLRYVDEGAYDGTLIHRVVPGFVIQGGGYDDAFVELASHDPIPNEWPNGLRNRRATIGMARDADPDSATRQWYINTADNDRLDVAREVSGGAGYAVFGRVVEGMDVVDRIEAVPTRDREDLESVPAEPVVVRRAARVP